MTKFSFDTIQDFDSHIELSVPNYSHLSELIRNISSYFIKSNTNVFDIGCSTGLLLKNLSVDIQQENVRYIGYDISENMRPKTKAFFEWVKKDITDKNLDLSNSSLILSVFTLQFLPLSERQNLLNKIYDSLNEGGSLIISEKTYLENSFLNDVFTFSYYDYKMKSFSESEILGKQRDLRYIMRPITESENIEMFKKSGFKKIECFFSSLLFKGWILVK
jgi:tRNA (cmo5U34)-methyltransferase